MAPKHVSHRVKQKRNLRHIVLHIYIFHIYCRPVHRHASTPTSSSLIRTYWPYHTYHIEQLDTYVLALPYLSYWLYWRLRLRACPASLIIIASTDLPRYQMMGVWTCWHHQLIPCWHIRLPNDGGLTRAGTINWYLADSVMLSHDAVLTLPCYHIMANRPYVDLALLHAPTSTSNSVYPGNLQVLYPGNESQCNITEWHSPPPFPTMSQWHDLRCVLQVHVRVNTE